MAATTPVLTRCSRARRFERAVSSTDLELAWTEGGRADHEPGGIVTNDGTVRTGSTGFGVNGSIGSNVFIYSLKQTVYNARVGVRLGTMPSASGISLWPRIETLNAGIGPSGYRFLVQPGSADGWLLRRTNGSDATGLKLVNGRTWLVGDYIEIEAVGAAFTLYINDVQYGTFTDSSNVYPKGFVGVQLHDLAARVTDLTVKPLNMK